ncbi:MAG: erythromycin biosynthesis sensory transduction protein eryC1, partial [Actinobacteria bacterium]
FPNSEQPSQSALSLPIYPGITPEDQEYVADCLKKALR